MTRVAVITGGAGGLGRALNARLAADGWHVVVVDRPGTALDACAAPGVEIHGCDLTDTAATHATCATIAGTQPAIDLVIHNVGVTHIGLFAESGPESHSRVFAINYFASVAVAYHLLHAVRAARGTHLAISSVAGFAPLHRRTAYAASKHAHEGFFKSLRSEEAPYGVDCLIAAPAFVATNPGRPEAQPDGTARPGSASDEIAPITPDDAARIILAGYSRRRAMIPVGRIARLAWWLGRLSPALFERQMRRRIDRH